MSELELDISLLMEFLDESEETLQSLPEIFIQLENEPGNLNLINQIFRPVHSVKGNSAFFGLLKVKHLAHEMENLLDALRKSELAVSSDMISALLEGIEKLQEIFVRVRNSENELKEENELEKLLLKIKSFFKSGEYDTAAIREVLEDIEPLLTSTILKDSQELLLINEAYSKLKKMCPDNTAVSSSSSNNPIQRILDILSENFEDNLEDEKSKAVLQELEEIKKRVQQENEIKIIEECIENYYTMTSSIGFDPLLGEVIVDAMQALQALNALVEPEEEKHDEGNKKTAIEKPSPTSRSAKTMRVPEDSIDHFLNYVGELIVVREMFDHLRRQYEHETSYNELMSQYKRHLETFHTISSELEKSCMQIRKQPIKNLIQKMPKIIRDVAAETNKKITTEIQGDELSVDKSLIGILESPLVHMIRNAADHGIELPEEREENGKDPAGVIKITCSEDEENLFISISDNGKGLDFKALHKKGIKNGLFRETEKVSQKQISQVIFMPGVSTAKEITDISGRGVGMDVVKSSIEEAGGKIEIESEHGLGSTFTLIMPKSVTTQIIQGFIVTVSGNNYVIPVKHVIESFPPSSSMIKKVHNKAEFVERHDNIVPVIRLKQLYHETSKESLEEGILVLVDYNGQKLALHVDSIVGIQQIVLKGLKGFKMNKEFFSGGALMGDGYVSLVMNVEKLFSVKSEIIQENNQAI